MKRRDLNEKKVLMNEEAIENSLNRIVSEIIEKNPDLEKCAVVGIRTRGEYLAARIVRKIKEIKGVTVPFGVIDIALYRDDFFKSLSTPAVGPSHFDFDIEEYDVILVDDVLFTARTIRAAIEALIDYGRPKSVQLAVLVDRGHRELPIRADYTGKTVDSDKNNEAVALFIKELDAVDKVVLVQK